MNAGERVRTLRLNQSYTFNVKPSVYDGRREGVIGTVLGGISGRDILEKFYVEHDDGTHGCYHVTELAPPLVEGKHYKLPDGKIVEFAYMGSSGKWAIVHPPGEPDMQSSWGVPPSELYETGQILDRFDRI